MTRRLILTIAIVAAPLATQRVLRSAAGADWTQWGGPTRNFVSDTRGLASSWPTTGPRKLWTRSLGEGHSAILSEDGRLYTMYRPVELPAGARSTEEVVVALDATTGKTIWEFKYQSPTTNIDFSRGAGPHSTPLIVGNCGPQKLNPSERLAKSGKV